MFYITPLTTIILHILTISLFFLKTRAKYIKYVNEII